MKRVQNNNKKILVAGDLMIDHYLWGNTDRVSPEAPVLVVDIQKETKTLGGAGNVINNLISLDAKVSVISAIGNDESGNEIISMLKNSNVDTSNILRINNRKTSHKTRIIATHQQMIRFDKESKERVDENIEIEVIKLIGNILKDFDAVLISDYNKGFLTYTITQELINQANLYNIPVLIDPKGKDYSKYKNATLLTPNKKEASLSTQIDIKDNQSLYQAGLKLKKDLNLKYSLITLSEEGIGIFDDTEMLTIKATAKEVYDVTGAGDTVLASLGIALAVGMDIKEAATFANLAAAVVVGKIGSATVTPYEIYSQENMAKESFSFKEIEEISKQLKTLNKKIVFTNGCFDLLHRGHVDYLQKSKSLGDVLIVGLNSDLSIKRLKGENRPIKEEKERAFILSALKCVDYVVIFHEETPYNLIKLVQPDTLTKGADYTNKEVVGSDIAKEVVLIEFTNGCSTTATISKIQG